MVFPLPAPLCAYRAWCLWGQDARTAVTFCSRRLSRQLQEGEPLMGIIIEMNLLSLTDFGRVRFICGISSKISSYLVPKSFLAMCNVPFEFFQKKRNM